MAIPANAIKELREMTSCGVIECKKALEEANGDMKKAKELLRQRGLEIAAKKGSREAKEGRIESYIHPGNKIGVMVEVNCETDFVANNEDFCRFTRDVALHIAAMNPRFIKQEDIPQELLKQQEDPKEFIKEACLLEQPFVKDPSKTIKDRLLELVASIGENIYIQRFIRYKVNDVQ